MSKKRYPAIAFILLLMAAVIVRPQRYLASVTEGLIIFWASVLPALFPFFFFTKLLTALGFGEDIGRIFEKPVKKLFKTPPVSAYIFFMSILCGYPVGAKLISDFYKNHLLNTQESKKIISFCSTSAPLFVIGTVGTFMLKDIRLAAVILFAHYLSAVFTGLLYCNFRPLQPSVDLPKPATAKINNIVGDSVNSAVISILSVGGLIAVFSMIIDVLADLRLFDLLAAPFDAPWLKPFLKGIAEMTRGILEITKNPPSIPLTLALITGLISFGGICIFLQSAAYLADAGVKARYYLGVKTTQAVIGGLLAYALGLLV